MEGCPGKASSRAGALATPPWYRAPRLLIRQSPTSFVACAVTMLILAAAASSGSLFLASTATAALHNEASLECPQASRAAVTNDRGPRNNSSPAQRGSRLAAADAAVTDAVRAQGLAAPYRITTTTVPVVGDTAFLFSRAGATSHVHMLSSVGGAGVYVPARFAGAHGVRAGSTMTVGSTRARVAGVYQDLAPSAFVPLFRLDRYWCTWRDALVPSPLNRPPPMFLTDPRTIIAAAPMVTSTWYDSVSTSQRTIGQAHSALAAMRRASGTMHGSGVLFSSQLPTLLAKSERVRDGLRGPVLPIVLAGCVVAALLVAASGGFWRVRRGRELALLYSRGVSPSLLAVKAVLENISPVVLGTVAGWGIAIGLVKVFGPSPQLESDAPWVALRLAGWAAAAAVLLIGVVVLRTVTADRVRDPHRVLRVVPWEGLLLVAAALAYLAVRRHGAVHIVRATVQVDPLVITFPLLAITGVLLLLGRGGLRAVTRLPRAAARLPTAGFLAVRRIAGTPLVAIGVFIGTALPIAVLVYGSALTDSTSNNVDAKYRTNVGASYAMGLLTHGHRADPGSHGTVVSMIDTTGTSSAVVLGIDPDTFSRFAYGGAALADDTDALRHGRTGQIPALLVNAGASTHISAVSVLGTQIPVDVVGRKSVFPGVRNPYQPVLVVDRSLLPQLDPNAERTEELWTTRDQLTPALASLARTGVEANYQITPNSFLDSTGLRPVTWIFGYLNALAVLTGGTALTGLGLAFAVRTRRRAFAYHLARRMGLTRATHRRSLALELGGLLGAAWGVGASLALGVTALTYRLTDAYPKFPPPPGFPDAAGPIWSTALVIAGLAGVATLLGQRGVERADPNRLLRGEVG